MSLANEEPKTEARERAIWALKYEEQRQAACARRKLPVTTTVEEMLAFEYCRGLQVAILIDDPIHLKKLARRVQARQANGKSA